MRSSRIVRAYGMKYGKHPISARIEDDIYRRLEVVAFVDRRSIAEVVSECVRRALPELENELQQPKLSPAMAARIQAGESVQAVLMEKEIAANPLITMPKARALK